MRIMMMTNTYLPHVGGVARSVAAFSDALRERGHEVWVVAPESQQMPPTEKHVIRVPAIQKFNGSDFSVVIPSDGLLQECFDTLKPDLIHSHHPFLLGGAAQRLAVINSVPLVFTHHTLYEQYTHYVPGDSKFMKRFVAALSTEYANLAQLVIAPSESIRDLLRARGVTTPIQVLPTGVDEAFFRSGNGRAFRKVMGIPMEAFVVGHVGRLAHEKNLEFLTESIARFLETNPDAWFLVAGTGPARNAIERICTKHNITDRVLLAGTLGQPILSSAYKAMNVFAFASQSETQGMVLTEAMAGRVPVVAVDASGVREVLRDGENGLMLGRQSYDAFVEALQTFHDMPAMERDHYRREALSTARQVSLGNCVALLEKKYRQLLREHAVASNESPDAWEGIMKKLGAEWNMLSNLANAAGKALTGGSGQEVS
jgi:glycosyltransferase involved in cell wall biosynthesis